MECSVNLKYDNDANVWIATSDDIKGLVLENKSLDALLKEVRNAIPELLSYNSNKINYLDVAMNAQYKERIALYG